MPFSAGDRVHLLNEKTYGGRIIAAGTLGTVVNYSSFLETYTVQFDGDSFIRIVRAIDLST